MKRFWGYLLGALLVLPLLLALPACKSAEKGAEKVTGVAEKMKQGTAGEALEELENGEDEGGAQPPEKEEEQLW